MKKNIKVLVLLIMVVIASVIFTKPTSAQQNNVSFQVFYDQLSPYGEWVNYPNWGYVWIPDAGADFVPYSTQGHWILTDDGWAWMSDYSWGWAPFHYGRWDYDQYYGWFWVPGNEWGPAWVSWRRADGYYGWAPLEPGISVSASFGRAYDSHNDHWMFVRDRDIDRTEINHYYINRTDQDRVVRYSSVINNTYVDNRRHTTYVTGPARTDFQKVSGRQVKPVTIQEYNKPGQNISNDHFQIYRPVVIKNTDQRNKPAPARITNLKDVKQPSERNKTNQQGNLNSTKNIKDVQKTNTVNPQKNIKDTKTLPSQNSDPPKNVKTTNQPVIVKSQNTNPSQNIKSNQQPNNVKTLNTNQSQNIKSNQQQNNVKTLNTNQSQNIKTNQQPNNVKTLNTNQSQNVQREQPPNNAKTFNTTPSQNNRRELQPNNVKISNTNQSQNTGKDKQSSASKSVKNNKQLQQNNANPEKDTK
jgi:hypothetical protein